MNFNEAKQLFDAATKMGVLLMTNFWTRQLPAYQWAVTQAQSGVIGMISEVQGDMAFQVRYNQ